MKEAVQRFALDFMPILTSEYMYTPTKSLLPVQSMPLLFMKALNSMAVRQQAEVFREVAKAALRFSYNDFCQRPELLDCLLVSSFHPVFSLALSAQGSRPRRLKRHRQPEATCIYHLHSDKCAFLSQPLHHPATLGFQMSSSHNIPLTKSH